MRIITKIVLLYLVLLVIALMVGGYFTYKGIQNEVRNETDYSLIEETNILVESIEAGIPITSLENRKTRISEVPLSTPEDKRGIRKDTLMLHIPTDNMEIFRSVTSVRHVDSAAYEITVTDVFIEEEDMLEGVTNIMIDLFKVIGILFVIAGFVFSRFLLKPFYNTLEKIKGFKVSEYETIGFSRTSTKEFKTLNQFLHGMMNKASSDYHALKEFSENASHELQTPVAIAKGKLEILQNRPNLEKEDFELISSSVDALNKITLLTDSLSLLTKLENREFQAETVIDFSNLCRRICSDYKEFASMKGLSLKSDIEDDVELKISESLAEILVNNLFKNAVKHNIENGEIEVLLNAKKFQIRNTGLPLKDSPESYFNRFKKNDQTSKSLGLGLSIVKKIVELNGFQISYQNGGDQKWHDFTVEF